MEEIKDIKPIKTEIENIEQEIEEKEFTNRQMLTIQQFMNDMSMLGAQVKNPTLKKPTFHYGDASVTNYLLWLLLGEIIMLNDKLDEVED
jgi:hypothetical protein